MMSSSNMHDNDNPLMLAVIQLWKCINLPPKVKMYILHVIQLTVTLAVAKHTNMDGLFYNMIKILNGSCTLGSYLSVVNAAFKNAGLHYKQAC